ncbi:MAG: Gldg family protein [Planctomycetota bacterium]
MFRWHVVSAVFWRNVKQYFSGPLGYLLIVLFVTACSALAFSPQFFANNLATLDQLSEKFPFLLLSVIPAITMTVWAEERKQGTDAILFTLPASDFDILLGKFFSVVAVYTIALVFSLPQVFVLEVLGNPDWGVIASTYLGYWLAGVALLSIGMFASSLTENATIAYVLGAAFCAIPVVLGVYFAGTVSVERFGFDWNLRDFTLGVVPLPNLAYFVAITVFMLYLNLIVISKRHWSRGQQVTLAGQFTIRAVALLVALVSMTFLSSSALSSMWSRLDLTGEKLYTLDEVTLTTLDKVVDDDRQVTIQAFISSEVPRKYVNTKKQFIGLLREFNEYGDRNVEVRFVDVKPNSEEALNAKRSGIEPVGDRSVVGGKVEESDVYMGALISSSIGDATLPFVADGTSLEYELSHALAATIDKKNKLTVGILETDAFFAGPEFEGQRAPWSYESTLDELRNQYKVKYYAPFDLDQFAQPKEEAAEENDATDEPKPQAPDVLIVADPSSLDDGSMDSLVAYLEAGNPAIMMLDPLPFFWAFQYPREVGILNAPKMGRISPRSPYAQYLTTSPMPKSDGGTASKVLSAVGIKWDSGSAAWSVDNPHSAFSGYWPPRLGARWPELYGPYEKAFVWARNNANSIAFNPDSPISNGLSEMLMFYPGSVEAVENGPTNFVPLVQLGPESGITTWDELTIVPKQEQQFLDARTGQLTTETTAARSQITGNDLVIMNSTPGTVVDDKSHVLAAHVTGKDTSKINVVVIADMDFVSDTYLTQQEALNDAMNDRIKQKLDNLVFLQNAIEVLADSDSFVRLRNRRAKPRTLTRLEQVINTFRNKTAKERETVELAVGKELKAEQDKLKKANEGVESNQELSFFQKIQQQGQQAIDAERRFELKKARLDKQLAEDLEELKANERSQITRLETQAQYLAVLLAPLPALILGIIVLWYRKVTEERGIQEDRRV